MPISILFFFFFRAHGTYLKKKRKKKTIEIEKFEGYSFWLNAGLRNGTSSNFLGCTKNIFFLTDWSSKNNWPIMRLGKAKQPVSRNNVEQKSRWILNNTVFIDLNGISDSCSTIVANPSNAKIVTVFSPSAFFVRLFPSISDSVRPLFLPRNDNLNYLLPSPPAPAELPLYLPLLSSSKMKQLPANSAIKTFPESS